MNLYLACNRYAVKCLDHVAIRKPPTQVYQKKIRGASGQNLPRFPRLAVGTCGIFNPQRNADQEKECSPRQGMLTKRSFAPLFISSVNHQIIS